MSGTSSTTTLVTARLPRDHVAALRRYATKYGLPISTVIGVAVTLALAETEEEADGHK
jgi:hypothetical protein